MEIGTNVGLLVTFRGHSAVLTNFTERDLNLALIGQEAGFAGELRSMGRLQADRTRRAGMRG